MNTGQDSKTLTINRLKVIASLGPGQTLSPSTMTLVPHKAWSTSIWRTYSGENRNHTITSINIILVDALSLAESDPKIIREIESALRGFNYLKETYKGDYYIIAEIDRIISFVNTELLSLKNKQLTISDTDNVTHPNKEEELTNNAIPSNKEEKLTNNVIPSNKEEKLTNNVIPSNKEEKLTNKEEEVNREELNREELNREELNREELNREELNREEVTNNVISSNKEESDNEEPDFKECIEEIVKYKLGDDSDILINPNPIETVMDEIKSIMDGSDNDLTEEEKKIRSRTNTETTGSIQSENSPGIKEMVSTSDREGNQKTVKNSFSEYPANNNSTYDLLGHPGVTLDEIESDEEVSPDTEKMIPKKSVFRAELKKLDDIRDLSDISPLSHHDAKFIKKIQLSDNTSPRTGVLEFTGRRNRREYSSSISSRLGKSEYSKQTGLGEISPSESEFINEFFSKFPRNESHEFLRTLFLEDLSKLPESIEGHNISSDDEIDDIDTTMVQDENDSNDAIPTSDIIDDRLEGLIGPDVGLTNKSIIELCSSLPIPSINPSDKFPIYPQDESVIPSSKQSELIPSTNSCQNKSTLNSPIVKLAKSFKRWIESIKSDESTRERINSSNGGSVRASLKCRPCCY